MIDVKEPLRKLQQQRTASAVPSRLHFSATTPLKLMTDAVSDSVPDDPAVVDVYAMSLNWFRGVSGERSGLRVGPHSSHSLS